jgi:hypothetical protein
LPWQVRRFHNKGSLKLSIHDRPLPVNNPTANGHELEYLTKAIAAAISRSRLTTNSLEAIAAALRHKEATVPEVVEWLKDEGLFEFVSRHVRGVK